MREWEEVVWEPSDFAVNLFICYRFIVVVVIWSLLCVPPSLTWINHGRS